MIPFERWGVQNEVNVWIKYESAETIWLVSYTLFIDDHRFDNYSVKVKKERKEHTVDCREHIHSGDDSGSL